MKKSFEKVSEIPGLFLLLSKIEYNFMKKIALFILFFLPITCFCQIRNLSPEQKQEERYDSISNISYESSSYRKYVGQSVTIVLNFGNKDGYVGFNNQPKSTNKKIPIDKLNGRCFEIIDVVEKTKEVYGFASYDGKFLKIRDKKTNDVLYYDCDKISLHNPFLANGYYEKIINPLIGKKFLYRSHDGFYEGIITLLKNGVKLKPKSPPEWWLFSEFVIDKNERISSEKALIVNEQGDEALVSVYDLINSSRPGRNFMSEIYLNFLTDLYGKEDSKLISEKRVKIGWPKIKCIDSWGFPEKTNTDLLNNVKKEQLVYKNGNCLYLENDILVAIQN